MCAAPIDGMFQGTAEVAAPNPGARARRRALPLALAAVGAGAAALGAVGWVGSERAIHPAVMRYEWDPGAHPLPPPEEVSIHSQTGVRIAGCFYAGANGATIVISHGWADNQQGARPWAAFLHRAGYNVFTYDSRGRGQSGGAAVTLGALEQYDLVSVVDYLVARPDVEATRIGALGISMGGATSILAAARDPRIRAVVDDCGYGDVRGVIDTSFRRFVGLPAVPFSPITVLLCELRAGVRVDAIRPVDRIAAISPRPVLIVHGQDDRDVLPAHGARLFAAAREPKEIWLVGGASHGASHATATAEYERRVLAFFRRWLST